MKKDRKCLNCGKDISNLHYNAKTCNENCRKELYKKQRDEKALNRDDGKIECLICGAKMNQIHKHLRAVHGTNIEDYKKEFNLTTEDCFDASYLKTLSNRVKGENNPAYNHQGKYSPNSRKFIKYEGLSEEEIDKKISDYNNKVSISNKENGNNDTTLDYWLNQGYSPDEARIKIRERQTTFSKEICIKKYGEVEGIKRWLERQEKWHKNYTKSNFSNISQELFWKVYKMLDDKDDIYFATLKEGEKDETGHNNEYRLKLEKSFILPDFIKISTNRILEFDGSYWHNRPGNVKRDKIRDRNIRSNGFQVLHIKEVDYKEDPQKVIKECVEFING